MKRHTPTPSYGYKKARVMTLPVVYDNIDFTPDVSYVCVCGTSTFDNKEYLFRKMDHLTKWMSKIVVVTGGQKLWDKYEGRYTGADFYAQEWAMKRWWPMVNFYAEWKEYGARAGPIRNTEMADFVREKKGVVVAFWDGKSPGTKDMIKKAKKRRLDYRVLYYLKKRKKR